MFFISAFLISEALRHSLVTNTLHDFLEASSDFCWTKQKKNNYNKLFL